VEAKRTRSFCHSPTVVSEEHDVKRQRLQSPSASPHTTRNPPHVDSPPAPRDDRHSSQRIGSVTPPAVGETTLSSEETLLNHSDSLFSYTIILPASVPVGALLSSNAEAIRNLCSRLGLMKIRVRDRLTRPPAEKPELHICGTRSAIRSACRNIEDALRRHGAPQESWLPPFDPEKLVLYSPLDYDPRGGGNAPRGDGEYTDNSITRL
jgi:hypothetical protein